MANRARLVRRLALATGLAAVGVTALATAGFGQLAGEPITANRFSLTIDGHEIASFRELSGLNSEVRPVVSLEGGAIAKLAGNTQPPMITLKRGMSGDPELWAWHETVRLGNVAQARRSVSLTMINDEGRPVAKYWLEKAWPAKMELLGLKAGETLVESVTLTAERIQRVAL